MWAEPRACATDHSCPPQKSLLASGRCIPSPKPLQKIMGVWRTIDVRDMGDLFRQSPAQFQPKRFQLFLKMPLRAICAGKKAVLVPCKIGVTRNDVKSLTRIARDTLAPGTHPPLCSGPNRFMRLQLVEQASAAQLCNHALERRLLRLRKRKLGGDIGHIRLHQVGLLSRQLRLLAARRVRGSRQPGQ